MRRRHRDRRRRPLPGDARLDDRHRRRRRPAAVLHDGGAQPEQPQRLVPVHGPRGRYPVGLHAEHHFPGRSADHRIRAHRRVRRAHRGRLLRQRDVGRLVSPYARRERHDLLDRHRERSRLAGWRGGSDDLLRSRQPDLPRRRRQLLQGITRSRRARRTRRRRAGQGERPDVPARPVAELGRHRISKSSSRISTTTTRP